MELAHGAGVMEMYAGVTLLVVTHISERLSVTRYWIVTRSGIRLTSTNTLHPHLTSRGGRGRKRKDRPLMEGSHEKIT